MRKPLTQAETAQVSAALELTQRRLRSRGKKFTPFGLLVNTPWVRLSLERRKPEGKTNIEAFPVSRVGNYLQVDFGETDWISWFTHQKMRKSFGSVRLHRVVCAVAGMKLDNVEIGPGVVEHLEVHHIDVNPLNNRVKNLVPLRRRIHEEVHSVIRRGDFEPYPFPDEAWLCVVFGGYTTGPSRLEAIIEDKVWCGPGYAATLGKIAAIVGDGPPDGIERAQVIAQAKVQNIGERNTVNGLAALVKAGLLGKAGHGRYFATYAPFLEEAAVDEIRDPRL